MKQHGSCRWASTSGAVATVMSRAALRHHIRAPRPPSTRREAKQHSPGPARPLRHRLALSRAGYLSVSSVDRGSGDRASTKRAVSRGEPTLGHGSLSFPEPRKSRRALEHPERCLTPHERGRALRCCCTSARSCGEPRWLARPSTRWCPAAPLPTPPEWARTPSAGSPMRSTNGSQRGPVPEKNGPTGDSVRHGQAVGQDGRAPAERRGTPE